MMQVSTLYAHSLERQLVSRRTQIIQNISRSCALEQQPQQQTEDNSSQLLKDKDRGDSGFSDENILSEAGILPPELQGSCSLQNFAFKQDECLRLPEPDSKEFTDRLCKLPKVGYIFGAPRRHSTGNCAPIIAPRICQSATDLSLTSHASLLKSHNGKNMDAKLPSSPFQSERKVDKQNKDKVKKEAKKMPSNFMLLGTWSTRHNCEYLLKEVKSGDVLEFNITLHHHWGIAIVPRNKKASLFSVEIVHLYREDNGQQKVIKQNLADYWNPGVTARINNSRDVHKHPLPATEVASAATKLMSQPYRIWRNSEQMITFCRYGEGMRSRHLSDAARWGTVSKCVGLLLSFTSSRQNSPAGSPTRRRKRTYSVNF